MVAKVRFWLQESSRLIEQGFVVGYDIEISIPKFFVYN